MSGSLCGAHSPVVPTLASPGIVVQLPAPRRLDRYPLSRSRPYAAVTVVRLIPQAAGQLALGRQAYPQRQPAVAEQTPYGGGQRGVVGAAARRPEFRCHLPSRRASWTPWTVDCHVHTPEIGTW